MSELFIFDYINQIKKDDINYGECFNMKGKDIIVYLDIYCCWCGKPITWVQDSFSGIGTIEKGSYRIDLTDFYICFICNRKLQEAEKTNE